MSGRKEMARERERERKRERELAGLILSAVNSLATCSAPFSVFVSAPTATALPECKLVYFILNCLRHE
jgi:hypothetical protein